MVYHGTFKNGVVVLEDAAALKEGQRVTVLPEEARSTTQKLSAAIAGAIKDDSPDASRNHDHYLYGAPKREPDS